MKINTERTTAMSFRNILKNLRRQNDMTQEELAEILGLTPQAVSRWENDAAIPDTATVRRLAYLFGVTTDYLLEVDNARMDDKAEEAIKSAREMEPEEAAQFLRDALKEFPLNQKLMSELAFYLYYRIYGSIPQEKKNDKYAKKILDEAIGLSEYLHHHGGSDVYSLLCMYRDAGYMEKGKELLDSLSDYGCVRQEMAIQLATGEEKIRLMQENAHILLSKLSWQIYMLSLESESLTPEQRTTMLECMFAASSILMPDDEAFFYNAQPTHIPWQLARRYSEIGNADEAIHWLEIMRDAAMKAESFEGEHRFRLRSPAFSGLELTRHGGVWGVEWMLDVMNDDYYNNVRSDPRFGKIEEELKSCIQ